MERRLGYLSSYFPKEIAHAFGFIPVRLMPKVRTATSAEGVLPRNFCAYLKLITASLADTEHEGPCTSTTGVVANPRELSSSSAVASVKRASR